MRQVFVRSGELLALVFFVTIAAPALTTVLVGQPVIIVQVVLDIGGALLIESIAVLIFLRPTVWLHWKTQGIPKPLLRLDMSRANLDAGRVWYELAVVGQTNGPIGWLALQCLTKRSFEIYVEVPNAPLFLTSDASRPAASVTRGKSITERADTDGVVLQFWKMPTRGNWIWGRVQFSASTYPTNDEFDFEFRKVASTRMSRVCAKIVKVQTSAPQVLIF